MRSKLCLSCTTLAAIVISSIAVLAQETTPTPTTTPSLEQLATNTDAAHHPGGAVEAIESFRCSLEMRLLDREAQNAGQASLDVSFLLWHEPGRKKARPLIRYMVRSSEQPIERGRDRNGPWQLQRGETVDLNSGQQPADLEQCNRHTNLARQLLRFLVPGEVLRGLQHASAPVRTDLRINRATRVSCWTVSGETQRFPLLQTAGEDTPVRLEVHVDASTSRLVAIDAWPLVDGKPVQGKGERILLEDLQERDGVLVPLRLIHLFRDERDALRPQTSATFTLLQLRPEIDVGIFDRDRGR